MTKLPLTKVIKSSFLCRIPELSSKHKTCNDVETRGDKTLENSVPENPNLRNGRNSLVFSDLIIEHRAGARKHERDPNNELYLHETKLPFSIYSKQLGTTRRKLEDYPSKIETRLKTNILISSSIPTCPLNNPSVTTLPCNASIQTSALANPTPIHDPNNLIITHNRINLPGSVNSLGLLTLERPRMSELQISFPFTTSSSKSYIMTCTNGIARFPTPSEQTRTLNNPDSPVSSFSSPISDSTPCNIVSTCDKTRNNSILRLPFDSTGFQNSPQLSSISDISGSNVSCIPLPIDDIIPTSPSVGCLSVDNLDYNYTVRSNSPTSQFDRFREEVTLLHSPVHASGRGSCRALSSQNGSYSFNYSPGSIDQLDVENSICNFNNSGVSSMNSLLDYSSQDYNPKSKTSNGEFYFLNKSFSGSSELYRNSETWTPCKEISSNPTKTRNLINKTDKTGFSKSRLEKNPTPKINLSNSTRSKCKQSSDQSNNCSNCQSTTKFKLKPNQNRDKFTTSSRRKDFKHSEIKSTQSSRFNHLSEESPSFIKFDPGTGRKDTFNQDLQSNLKQNLLKQKKKINRGQSLLMEKKSSRKESASKRQQPLDCRVLIYSNKSPKLQNGRVHPDVRSENISKGPKLKVQSNPELLIHPKERNKFEIHPGEQYHNKLEMRWMKVHCKNHPEKQDKSSQTDDVTREIKNIPDGYLNERERYNSREELNEPVDSIPQKLRKRTRGFFLNSSSCIGQFTSRPMGKYLKERQSISNSSSSKFKQLENPPDGNTEEVQDDNERELTHHKIPRWISWFAKTDPDCVHDLELTTLTSSSKPEDLTDSHLPMELYMTQVLVSSIRSSQEVCLAYSMEFYEKMFYPSVPCGQCHYCWITGNRK